MSSGEVLPLHTKENETPLSDSGVGTMLRETQSLI
jgi:hypothetical protein